jgi:gamma-glutamylcyclotransferase (GGCT)/AIG2-like uncharacterized protein YtfP
MQLFTYGSLVFPEVMTAVTGRTFEHRDAVLRDHRRRMLRGRVYPGIRFAAGEVTEGRVYLDLDTSALASLDDFEGEEYERRTVVVGVGSERLSAEAYVLGGAHHDLMTAALWDARRFAGSHLRVYVARCRRFRNARIASVA